MGPPCPIKWSNSEEIFAGVIKVLNQLTLDILKTEIAWVGLVNQVRPLKRTGVSLSREGLPCWLDDAHSCVEEASRAKGCRRTLRASGFWDPRVTSSHQPVKNQGPKPHILKEIDAANRLLEAE